jgi:parallel beta-helix repeat protein/VCBS repeat-containing protein
MTLLYVSTTGSDSNSGTSTSPVKSITRAAQLAQPGDTVMVHGGTYNSTVTISKSGTASAPITFKPVSGEHVIIDGSQTSSGSTLVTIDGDYVTFQGFEVRNAQKVGISLWTTHDSKVLNNDVHDSERAGIWAGGSTSTDSYNNLIDGNKVWHNVQENSGGSSSGGWAQAIGLYASDGTIIRNNTSYDNYGEGIGVQSTIGAKVTGNIVRDNYSMNIYLDNAQGAVAQNNTVYHTYDTEFYRDGKPAWGIRIANEYVDRPLPSKDIVVTNNILGGVGNVGYSTYGANTGLSNSTISPNTVYSSPDPIINGSGGSSSPTPVDHGVTAVNDQYSVTKDKALTVDVSKGVLVNDTAEDGGKAATAGTFATTQGGSLKLNTDGSFVYTPKTSFTGSDSFKYTVKDGDGDSATGTVTFAVADTTTTTTTTKTITGTSSSETLTGTSGNDLIDGKAGDDKISGKDGSDVLTGGADYDTFVFDAKLGSTNVDVVTDFNGYDDMIQLDDAIFTRLSLGKLSSSAFVTGDKALDSSDRIIYNKTTGVLSYDADGSGSGAAIKFATMQNKAGLTAADFLVI